MNFLVGLLLCLAVTRISSFDGKQTPGQNRIVNGLIANAGQFPYQVGMKNKIDSFETTWCGGALISNKWVLTAAHCIERAQSTTLYFGATSRHLPQEKQEIDRSKFIIHPERQRKTMSADIALISLNKPVSFNTKIQAIKLPSIASSYDDYDGRTAIISGWGFTSDAPDAAPAQNLNWATIKLIRNSLCRRFFGTVITDSHICSEGAESSTCSGDSGGPLVLANEQLLIGLTSFGSPAGCEHKLPEVFCRITTYLTWIKSVTGIFY